MTDLVMGFTGTQKGMTIEQEETVRYIVENDRPTWIAHGDCVGADSDCHDIAVAVGVKTWGFPPVKPDQRAWRAFDRIEKEAPYLERNAGIVKAADLMVACPASKKRTPRSGTWWTIDCAYDEGVPVTIVWPDGTTKETPHEDGG